MIHLAYTIFQAKLGGEREYWNRLNRIRIINFNKLEGVVGGTILSTSGMWNDKDLEEVKFCISDYPKLVELFS